MRRPGRYSRLVIRVVQTDSEGRVSSELRLEGIADNKGVVVSGQRVVENQKGSIRDIPLSELTARFPSDMFATVVTTTMCDATTRGSCAR